MKHRRAQDLRITSIVATPVQVPWRQGKGPHLDRENTGDPSPKYILRAGTNMGWVGLGETYERVNVDHLRRNAKMILNVDFDELQVNRLPIPQDREYDGFELMVYDILGHELKVPAYQLLGDACRDRVETAYFAANMKEMVTYAGEARNKGFDCMVVSCNTQEIVECCKTIDAACGKTMRMILSLQQPWENHEQAAAALSQVESLNILAVEGVLAVQDHIGLGELRKACDLPVSLDVRLTSRSGHRPGAAVLDTLKHEACDALVIHHAMAAFVRLADLAELAGLACRHGGEGDLGILEAGYVHAAAASPACIWPSNIFGRTLREHDLLKTPLVFSGKQVVVPQRPGLGVVLDINAMHKYRAGDDIVLAG